jgi:hypothetical protein
MGWASKGWGCVMKDSVSPKEQISRKLQDRERVAREKVFERLIEYAITEGFTIDRLEAMDQNSLLRLIEEWKDKKERPC